VTEAQINHQNRLAGPAGLLATGPPLTKEALTWPSDFKAAFSISVRPLRWQGMQTRLGPWASKVQLWSGTNGQSIDVSQWSRSGKSSPGCTLKRGQLGCYDSHVRVWQHIVRNKIPMALIMEDDANIRYIKAHEQRINNTLAELKRLGTRWDMLYIGRSNGRSRKTISPTLNVPQGCGGLFAYVVTTKGAEIMLKHASPYTIPVDVMVSNLHDRGTLNAVAMSPPLCYVVPVRSDTEGIH